jgi:hypothetical protein
MKKNIFALTVSMILMVLNLQNLNAFSGGSGNSANDPFLISTAADLGQVRTVATQGKYFKMTADITLTGEWIPIGAWGSDGATGAFQGHFDGDGHTVTGLQVTTGGDRGLFGWVKNATIKNLTVRTSATGISGNIETGDNYAILAGSVGNGWIDGNTTIENCTVSGTVNGRAACGALIGQSSHITVLNCKSENVNIKGTQYNISGLIGVIGGGNDTPSVVRNCTVTNATIESVDDNVVGGLIGTIESDPGYAAVENCKVSNVTLRQAASKWMAGGLIGKCWRAHISDCIVDGATFYGYSFGAGGMIGEIGGPGDDLTIATSVTNCHAYNINFPEAEWRTGGFVGCIFNQATITGCSATSTINSFGDCAGFIGVKESTGIISRCKAFATIKARNYTTIVGGFIAYNQGSGLIDNCFFAGSIEVENPALAEFTNTKVGGFA